MFAFRFRHNIALMGMRSDDLISKRVDLGKIKAQASFYKSRQCVLPSDFNNELKCQCRAGVSMKI